MHHQPSFHATNLDSLLVSGFVDANESYCQYINQSLQLQFENIEYAHLKSYFHQIVKKNPTTGELILLDALAKNTPWAEKIACGELFCRHPIIAETWQDIMSAQYAQNGVTTPVTLDDILSLPRKKLIAKGLLPKEDILPFFPSSQNVHALSLHHVATHEILSSRRMLGHMVECETPPPQGFDPQPKIGDAILLIPHANQNDILAFLQQHKCTSYIKNYCLVAQDSLLKNAISLAQDEGLYIQMDTFLGSPSQPNTSRMRLYTQACEQGCKQGFCHVLIRTAPNIENALIFELAKYGFLAYHYALTTKAPRVLMVDRGVNILHLPTDFLQKPLPPRLMSYSLPDKVSLTHPSATPHLLSIPRVNKLSAHGVLLSHMTISLDDTHEGYAAMLQSVLTLVGKLANVGVPYHTIHLSPIINYQGHPTSPLLLSALCGLYRISCELGIPVEHHELHMTPTPNAPNLILSLYAYAPDISSHLSPEKVHDVSVNFFEAIGDTLDFARMRQILQEMASHGEISTPPELDLSPLPYPTLQYLAQREANQRKEKANMEKIKAFESLSQRPRKVILDTDIGPDCDDVGALATLIHYAKKYNFPIIGVCNCTSNRAGNGVVDAVCRRCGIATPPMGQWSGEEFMNQQEHHKYNDAVAEKFSEGYRNGTLDIADEVTFYRTLLASAQDNEVMVISIGMFNNLAALLRSPADEISPLTGVELVKAKVYALVSMAAILPEGRECNVLCDAASAKEIFDNWPTPIYLSDFYIGLSIKTGYKHITDPETIEADPLVMSYHYYTKEWGWDNRGDNASYDLTAVQFAALGVGDLYGLCDTPGRLEFYAAIPDQPNLVDATRFIPDPMGQRIFMTKKVADEVIAQSLNDILHNI